MHKISAVKCKGKSPTYSKQTKTKPAPPKASGDVPSGAPKKKTRRGGKGKAEVHAIISSALVPPSVTNRMQKTHHAAAPVGFMGQEGPHTMRKPPVAWKGMVLLKPPVSLEAGMACAAIVKNVVVSSSHVTLDPPPAPSGAHCDANSS